MANALINITEARKADTVVLGIQGRLDANTSPEFEQSVVHLIDGGHTRFVFDLAELQYISSAGLRVFLMASNLLRGSQGRMALAALSPPVYQIFDLAGFTEILTIYPSRDEALQAVA